MIRLAVAVISGLSCLGQSALAQDPQVSFELDSETAIVGQPVTLRIQVLVPTWMPKPAVFPNVEVPSLMVRLPERATGPVSQRIGGATWSGVQRSYRLYPLAAGPFELPDGEIVVTYADPDTSDPVEFRAPLPDIRFAARVPAGARGLNPPVIARGFALDQTLEGATELAAGDAITRTITARIEGTTPVLIPTLTAETEATAVRAYGKEPVISETEERGVLSGTRVETTTYVGQSAGEAILPGLTIDWFNVESGQVETATVPETVVTVTGSALSAAPPMSPREIARRVGWGLLGALGLWLAWTVLRPPLFRALAEARAGYEASERAAHRRLMRALRTRDLSASLAAVEKWAGFFPDLPQAALPVRRALAGIGAARFGRQAETGKPAWNGAERAAQSARRAARRAAGTAGSGRSLPPLNP
ncbi:hypothetical protein QO034_11600 [Sedimentitalea sp. JM2-8]|uniref:Oxygen tolerance n=1 Tax=Sedimentitalea xiamensis TaxID=3050037 RepID=A0ABT7FF51_9RHOB|nr:hypothetical protein [Sedimentitalea xiamensis]MDK3073759.1 hypothetical protein [Sedimentitalea xiamensis]